MHNILATLMRVSRKLSTTVHRSRFHALHQRALVDQQVASLRFAHSLFEVFLFDALAAAVSDELRDQSRDYRRSDDTQDSARDDRGSNTEKRGDDAGFCVTQFWPRGVADHLQSGEPPAQVMRNRLTPDCHSKNCANHV